MNNKIKNTIPRHFSMRPLAILVPLLASQGAMAVVPVLSANINSVGVASGGSSPSYNSGAAVCNVNKDDGLTVTANVSATFSVGSTSTTTFGNCTKHEVGSGKTATTDYYYQVASYEETTVSKQNVTVTAADKYTTVPLSGAGPSTYSGICRYPIRHLLTISTALR